MSEPFLGTVMPVAFQFAPQDWQTCQGQQLQIQQNNALYSLLGTTFGGNGSTNFNLPDLQGRSIIGTGTSNGTVYNSGNKAGAASVTLTANQLPAHVHPATVTAGTNWTPPSVKIASTGAASAAPSTTNNVLANAADQGGDGVFLYAPSGTSATIPLGGFSPGTAPTPTVTVGANTTSGAAISTMSPYLALYYVIAISGLYPTRP
jgi:microcystin-dependent protein